MFLFIMLGILIYGISVSLVTPYMERYQVAKCPNCSTGTTYMINGDRREPGWNHGGEGFGRALAWPLTLPYVLATKSDPRIKAGYKAVERYWDDKAETARIKQLEALERDAGLR